jgi:hypothetical protein
LGIPVITCEWEVFHEAFGYATRSRHSFRRPIIGGYARVRVRRLWSESPYQQCVGPMRMGRPKPSLVPKTYGPHSRSHAGWDDALLQVTHLLSASPVERTRPRKVVLVLEHDLFRKPVPIPDEVGRASSGHAPVFELSSREAHDYRRKPRAVAAITSLAARSSRDVRRWNSGSVDDRCWHDSDVQGCPRRVRWSAPLGVDRCDAVQLAICRACSSSNLTGLLYPSAEWRRLAL